MCSCCRGKPDPSGSTSGSGCCPQWPDRCCLCCSKRAASVLAGLYCVLANLAVLLPCVYALVRPDFWTKGYIALERWVTANKWDEDVTTNALLALGALNRNHALFLIVVIAVCALHIFNSLLLVLGALLGKRLAMLPWMIQDALMILAMGLLFVFWAFFSFFVHMLVAVLFPVVAGLVLGFWVYMWRNVAEHFGKLGTDSSDSGPHQATLYRKLPAGSGTRSLLIP